MIEVHIGELADAPAEAVLRPVSCDFSPVTATMARFDLLAGDAVAEQCRRVGDLPMGSAVITPAGDLDATFIIHVAVRSHDENPTPALVRRGLVNGLRRLEEWGIETVAIAPLGTGAGNLDADEAAEAMVPVLLDHLRTSDPPVRVTVVVEDAYQREAFEAAVARHEAQGAERAS
jgi:O-acetyl-ADP-ribose deacetylase (regulator of RNase III)